MTNILTEKLILVNTKGWKKDDINLKVSTETLLSGETHAELKKAYELTKIKRTSDFNGKKVSVKKLVKHKNNKLIIEAVATDYFTLWGISEALPDILKKSNNEFIASNKTHLPCGLYIASMVLSSDDKFIMSVISNNSGFGAGRISYGFEEQSELGDQNPSVTAIRGFEEEIGGVITSDQVSVLGFGKSLDIAYLASYCLIKTDLTSKEIVEKKSKAKDQNESSFTLVVPIREVDNLCTSEVSSSKVNKYVVGTKRIGTNNLLHHRANINRWKLVKKYLSLS